MKMLAKFFNTLNPAVQKFILILLILFITAFTVGFSVGITVEKSLKLRDSENSTLTPDPSALQYGVYIPRDLDSN